MRMDNKPSAFLFASARLKFFPHLAADICLPQNSCEQIPADFTLVWVGKNKLQLPSDHKLALATCKRTLKSRLLECLD